MRAGTDSTEREYTGEQRQVDLVERLESPLIKKSTVITQKRRVQLKDYQGKP